MDLPAGLDFANRTYTAKAISPCKTLIWTQDAVLSLLLSTPLLHCNIAGILNRQLLDLQERYNELAGDRVERRLACMLLRLASQIGTPIRGGTRVDISRQELAQMSGTNIFSVSRIVSRWADRGLVIPCREAVIVADRARLELVGSLEPASESLPARPSNARRIAPQPYGLLPLVPVAKAGLATRKNPLQRIPAGGQHKQALAFYPGVTRA